MTKSLPTSNFDVLRLVAVGIVVMGNGLVLTGGSPPGLWGAPLPRVGLDLLFAISGFLVAESAKMPAPLSATVWRKALRVLPALVVSVILTAIVLGPLATTLSFHDYFIARETRSYLLNAVLFPHPFLPHVFDGQQWSGAINPMLWTLSAYGFGCAVVLALARSGFPMTGAMLLALVFALAALTWPSTPQDLPRYLRRPEIADAMPELPFFFAAATLSGAGRRWPGLWRADLAMLAFGTTWIAASWIGSNTIVLLWLTLPYMAVCFGRMTLPGLPTLLQAGKPAYGTYLYAFPLQQLIVARAPEIGHPILLCLLAAIAAGLLSWHCVERPALKWAGAER